MDLRNSAFKLIDIGLTLLACSVAYKLRFDTYLIPPGYLLPTMSLVIFNSLSFSVTGLYSSRHLVRKRQATSLYLGLSLSLLSTSMILYLAKIGADYSRLWSVISAIITFIFILSYRTLISASTLARKGKVYIIIVGTSKMAKEVFNIINSKSDSHFTVDRHFKEFDRNVLKFVELRRTQNNETTSPISEIWVTHDVYKNVGYDELTDLIDETATPLVFIPEIPVEVLKSTPNIEYINSIPTIESRMSDSARLRMVIKRAADLIASIFAITLLSPLLGLISITIKLESTGPVIYKQKRYGTNGKEFVIFKFRTMSHTPVKDDFAQAQRNDPRVTKVGKYLRSSSIDELPQLINVLLGQMSLVGPRPLPKELNEQYRSKIPKFMKRHHVKPGITGLAQVNGSRGETPTPESMERRIALDLEYIKNWSLYLDIRIIVATIWHLLSDRDVY